MQEFDGLLYGSCNIMGAYSYRAHNMEVLYQVYYCL